MSRIPLDTNITDSNGSEYPHDKGDQSTIHLQDVTNLTAAALGDFIPGESVTGLDPKSNAWKLFRYSDKNNIDEINWSANLSAGTVLSKDALGGGFKQEKVQDNGANLTSDQQNKLDNLVSTLKQNTIKKSKVEIEIQTNNGELYVNERKVQGQLLQSVEDEVGALIDEIMKNNQQSSYDISIQLQRKQQSNSGLETSEAIGVQTAVPALINGTLIDLHEQKGEALDMRDVLNVSGDEYYALRVIPHTIGNDESVIDDRVGKDRHGDADFLLSNITDKLGDAFLDENNTGLQVIDPASLYEDGSVLIALISVPSNTSDINNAKFNEVLDARPIFEEITDQMDSAGSGSGSGGSGGSGSSNRSTSVALASQMLARTESLSAVIAGDGTQNETDLLNKVNNAQSVIDSWSEGDSLDSIQSSMASVRDEIESITGGSVDDQESAIREVFDQLNAFVLENELFSDMLQDQLDSIQKSFQSHVSDFDSFKQDSESTDQSLQNDISQLNTSVDEIEQIVDEGGMGSALATKYKLSDIKNNVVSKSDNVVIDDESIHLDLSGGGGSTPTTLRDLGGYNLNQGEYQLSSGIVSKNLGFPSDFSVFSNRSSTLTIDSQGRIQNNGGSQSLVAIGKTFQSTPGSVSHQVKIDKFADWAQTQNAGSLRFDIGLDLLKANQNNNPAPLYLLTRLDNNGNLNVSASIDGNNSGASFKTLPQSFGQFVFNNPNTRIVFNMDIKQDGTISIEFHPDGSPNNTLYSDQAQVPELNNNWNSLWTDKRLSTFIPVTGSSWVTDINTLSKSGAGSQKSGTVTLSVPSENRSFKGLGHYHFVQEPENSGVMLENSIDDGASFFSSPLNDYAVIREPVDEGNNSKVQLRYTITSDSGGEKSASVNLNRSCIIKERAVATTDYVKLRERVKGTKNSLQNEMQNLKNNLSAQSESWFSDLGDLTELSRNNVTDDSGSIRLEASSGSGNTQSESGLEDYELKDIAPQGFFTVDGGPSFVGNTPFNAHYKLKGPGTAPIELENDGGLSAQSIGNDNGATIVRSAGAFESGELPDFILSEGQINGVPEVFYADNREIFLGFKKPQSSLDDPMKNLYGFMVSGDGTVDFYSGDPWGSPSQTDVVSQSINEDRQRGYSVYVTDQEIGLESSGYGNPEISTSVPYNNLVNAGDKIEWVVHTHLIGEEVAMHHQSTVRNIPFTNTPGNQTTFPSSGEVVYDVPEGQVSDITDLLVRLDGTLNDGDIMIQISGDGGSSYALMTETNDRGLAARKSYSPTFSGGDIRLKVNLEPDNDQLQTPVFNPFSSSISLDNVPLTSEQNAIVDKVNELVNAVNTDAGTSITELNL